jgi:mitogen-activated protein kinase 1/3
MTDSIAAILESFDVGPRYVIEKPIGYGAYGMVVQSLDTDRNEHVYSIQVAIKKLNKLEDIIDAKRNLREIRTMRCLQHDGILSLKKLIHKK